MSKQPELLEKYDNIIGQQEEQGIIESFKENLIEIAYTTFHTAVLSENKLNPPKFKLCMMFRYREKYVSSLNDYFTLDRLYERYYTTYQLG